MMVKLCVAIHPCIAEHALISSVKLCVTIHQKNHKGRKNDYYLGRNENTGRKDEGASV